MQQIQELGIKCPVNDHDYAYMVCLDKTCKDIRVFCDSCDRKGEHASCRKDHQKLQTTISKFQEIEKESESLKQDLLLTAKELYKLFTQIIQIITKKYQYSKQRLEKLNAIQLHQALDHIIKYDEFQNKYLQEVKQCSKNMILQLENIIAELKLENIVDTQELDPKEKVEHFYQKGYQLYSEDDNYEQAIKLLDLSLLIDPNHINSLFIKADCLRLLGNYTDAITWADKALSVNSKHVDSLHTKAGALLMLDNPIEALRFADKALSIDPKHAYSIHIKGESLRLLDQYENAIKILDQALHYDPNYVYSLASKGACLQSLEKYNEAIQSYNKALQINPNFQWAQDKKTECENQLKKNP
ncbi:unnamed protein product (macronuclear) [Paramecium tetraurelia]|uniref:Uncharacterized protein n=1 Tax=Paramecium tetraurelia TaxID=5888 RepID=A0DI94_PARTE|nr:uncharacterized protein GSPATT00017133001 [Paramecium tetraurelia]CAK82761.1 unnamed protein product [Paramecium tetraurelia]|eukprot:XP_001450158.1 hypothetical protein (macronuclear) [Paramecium tetraurelia strain d4-2]